MRQAETWVRDAKAGLSTGSDAQQKASEKCVQGALARWQPSLPPDSMAPQTAWNQGPRTALVQTLADTFGYWAYTAGLPAWIANDAIYAKAYSYYDGLSKSGMDALDSWATVRGWLNQNQSLLDVQGEHGPLTGRLVTGELLPKLELSSGTIGSAMSGLLLGADCFSPDDRAALFQMLNILAGIQSQKWP